MTTTVEITSADDGTFTVGIVDQPSADVDDQQQVQDIGAALKMAQHLLQSPPADNGNDEDDQSPNQNAQTGGQSAGPSGPMAQGQSTADASASQPSAQDIWNQLAQKHTPPH